MSLLARFTPPDWRWQVATALAAGKSPALLGLPPADAAVHRAVQALGGRPTRIVARAIAVRDGPALVRGELEGRALAGESPAAIARALKLSAPAVREYLALFFDAESRRDEEPWLYWAAGGYDKVAGPITDPAAVLRWVAYRLGPVCVEMVARLYRRGLGRASNRDIDALPDVDAEEREDLRTALGCVGTLGMDMANDSPAEVKRCLDVVLANYAAAAGTKRAARPAPKSVAAIVPGPAPATGRTTEGAAPPPPAGPSNVPSDELSRRGDSTPRRRGRPARQGRGAAEVVA